jgi:hypothetical protein
VRSDVRHVCVNLGASAACDLFPAFVAELSRAIFEPFQRDHDKLDQVLRALSQGTADQLRTNDVELYYTLVRCLIPEPEIYWPRVEKLLREYQYTKDETGRRLFSEAKLADWPGPIEDLRIGNISDLPDVEYHVEKGIHPKYNLMMWARRRGTNLNERMNREFNQQFSGINLRPEVGNYMALCICVVFNLLVRTSLCSSSRLD